MMPNGFERLMAGLRELIAREEDEAAPPEPVQRDTAIGLIGEQLYEQLNRAGYDEDAGGWHYLADIYVDDLGSLFAISSAGGSLFRWAVTADRGEFSLSNKTQVQTAFQPTGRLLSISRAEDGSYSGLVSLASAVLNHSGEIDSRALFDEFVERFKGDGSEFVNFHHQKHGISRLAGINRIWRDGYILLGHIEFDDDEIARAAAQTLAADDEGEWGFSIEYWPEGDAEQLRISNDVSIPVYNHGWLAGASIAKRAKVASHFTGHAIQETSSMDATILNDLKELVGEENADAFAARIDGANTEIERERMIARDAAGAGAAQADAGDSAPGAPEDAAGGAQDTQIVIDDTLLTALTDQLTGSEMWATLTGTVSDIQATMAEMSETLVNQAAALATEAEGLRTRLDQIEKARTEAQDYYDAQAPAGQRTYVYKPGSAGATHGSRTLPISDPDNQPTTPEWKPSGLLDRE